MTHERIKRFDINRSGRRYPVPLDARIREWATRNPRRSDLAEALLAVKWIGNTGSHGADALDRSDLFDGFDLLKHVLTKILDTEPHEQGLRRLAEVIVKKKKPRSKHGT